MGFYKKKSRTDSTSSNDTKSLVFDNESNPAKKNSKSPFRSTWLIIVPMFLLIIILALILTVIYGLTLEIDKINLKLLKIFNNYVIKNSTIRDI